VLIPQGAPQGYGRRWAASLEINGKKLEATGDFVQLHEDFWTSIRPTLDGHLQQLANEIEAFFVRMNGDLTETRYFKDWARTVEIAFDKQAIDWKNDLNQVNSRLSEKQVDPHFLPEVSFGFAPDKGELYTIHIETVDLLSHWDSPGTRIQVEGTIDLTPAQDLSSSQFICTWPIKIGAISEDRARPKNDQISCQTSSKSAIIPSCISLPDTISFNTGEQGSNENPPTCHIIDFSETQGFAMSEESLRGSAPQIFESKRTPSSWLAGSFR
jgi:hypothetical protein